MNKVFFNELFSDKGRSSHENKSRRYRAKIVPNQGPIAAQRVWQ